MEKYGNLFAVLGDPTRQQILHVLADARSLRAKDILDHLEISQPTLSHHMHLLVSEKLVHVQKVGRECFYSVREESIAGMISELSTLLPEKKPSGKRNAEKPEAEPVEEKKKNKDKKDRKEKKKKRKNK
ncbi:MAG: helix-turn-helix transcriptional regulator [Clostridiales bacterium]|nr:helix-turn-helix transcriptional regulator [Clostridiales bacterium]